jgi:poly(A) polymerase
VRDELVKLLTGPDPVRGVSMLLASGLLEEILPEVSAMVDVPQPARFHPEGDVYTHTLAVLSRIRPRTARLALAGLLHDVGKPVTLTRRKRVRFDQHAPRGADMAEEILRRLRLSRAETAAIRELVADHLRFMAARKMRDARLRRFLTGPLGRDHMALHRADCEASHGDLTNWQFCRERLEAWELEPSPPPRLAGGRDLIDLGLSPGPAFAPILSELEDLTLEKRIRTREEALRWLRKRVSGGGDADEE